MILKPSDFKGKFAIANADDRAPNSDMLGNNVILKEFIDDYEEECLILTLGYTNYILFKAQLDINESNGIKSGADAKWDELLNGKENYRGMRTMLKAYVFYHFLERDESTHTGVGIQKQRGKGSSEYTPRTKAVKAWRTFYEHAIGKSPYPDVIVRDMINGRGFGVGIIYSPQEDKQKSLYQFLADNTDVYPDVVMSSFDNQNYHGI